MYRRLAFRGPLILGMSVKTTGKTPSHAHTIAKNLLDLVGRPLPSLDTRRRGLLYFDDMQVQGLSVHCVHGEPRAEVLLEAVPLRHFLQDLDLAHSVLTDHRNPNSVLPDSGGVAGLRELLDNEQLYRARLGDDGYQGFERMMRYDAQQEILGQSQFDLTELAALFRARGLHNPLAKQALDGIFALQEEMSSSHPMRILLPELPRRQGTSESYRQQVTERIRDFGRRFDWVLRPLQTPVALEVVVKPPARGARGRHDLDNVLRKYIIPPLVDSLQPPSDYVWTIDKEFLKEREQLSALWSERLARLPPSTRVGLTRFEAWRLPRTPGDRSSGFVSAALVADPSGYSDVIRRLDSALDRWGDAID
jgi:hypothetical protein